MLSVQELIEIERIPEETEITLQLLVDFYEEYLCKYVFQFDLANGENVKLLFKDPTELFHISGIKHIYRGSPMDGTRFLEGIKNGKIGMRTVRNMNPNAYKDFQIRIRSVACIDTIIKKCEYLLFSNGKIPDSDIKVRYLLFKGLDDKNVHLGIDTHKKGRPYFAKTLLVTEGGQKEKYMDRADKRLKVLSIQIKNKETDEIIKTIERQKAIMLAQTEIKRITSLWMENEFKELFAKYYKNLSAEEKQKIKVQGITRKKRAEWRRLLINELENQKKGVINLVEKLDPYCAGKNVAEVMHGYEKEVMEDLTEVLGTYMCRLS